jgi:hypothetical protein
MPVTMDTQGAPATRAGAPNVDTRSEVMVKKRNLSKKKYRSGSPKGIPAKYVRLHCIHEAAHTVVAAATPGAQVGPIVVERHPDGDLMGRARACLVAREGDLHTIMFLVAGHLAWAKEDGKDPWESLAMWARLETQPGDDMAKLRAICGSEEELRASVALCRQLLDENWKAVRCLGEEYMASGRKGLTHQQVEALLKRYGVKVAKGVVFTPNPQPRFGPPLP